MVDSGEPLVSIDVDVDGNKYEDIRSAVDPNPLFNLASYYTSEYADVPMRKLMFPLDDIQMGYNISITIKCSSQCEFKLLGGTLDFRMTGRKNERNEP